MVKTTGTRDKLRESARELFSRYWFETISIAEICRHARVSNGVFYRYYSNKQELIRDLMEEFLDNIQRDLSHLIQVPTEQRVPELINIIFAMGSRYADLVSIYREGQYRLPEYDSRLGIIHKKYCDLSFGRTLSDIEYLYVFSGMRFISTRALYDDVPRNPEIVYDLIMKGVFPDDEASQLAIPEQLADVPSNIPADTRERLIENGIKLIGSNGYHDIGIADIVRSSGLAVGTFYTYFESKEVFLKEIISIIGKRTRGYLSERTMREHTRLEQEIHGQWNFLSYFNRYIEYYSIVREAEFVGKEWVRDYYNAFEQGYIRNLNIPDENRARTTANFLMGIGHYLGIETLLNNRIDNIPELLDQLSLLMQRGVTL